MKIEKISADEFKKLFDEAYPKLKYKEFVGYKTDFSDSDCYRVKNKLAGFAITNEKELVNVFNAEEDYKLFDDTDITSFIEKEVDWICCIETHTFDDSKLGDKWSFEKFNGYGIASYYCSKLKHFGTTCITTEDIYDMIYSRGFQFTLDFMNKYGVPHHEFLVNLRGHANNYSYGTCLSHDEYDEGKSRTLAYVKQLKTLK